MEIDRGRIVVKDGFDSPLELIDSIFESRDLLFFLVDDTMKKSMIVEGLKHFGLLIERFHE